MAHAAELEGDSVADGHADGMKRANARLPKTSYDAKIVGQRRKREDKPPVV